MRHMIVAALLALAAGAALASDVTPYDKELATQMLFPKKATTKADQGQPTTVATACTCKR